MKTTSIYSSGSDGKIFQTKPPFSKPSQFRPKGWTETTLGYINEAKQLTQCILRNRKAMKRPYTWTVHININVELSPVDITNEWTKTCRTLRRKGIIALWVREPNKVNKVHYHLLIKDPISRKELSSIIEEAMPPRSQIKWRKCIQTIENEWRYAYYITKAKIRGRVRGKMVSDMHARKRRLFKANLKLKKYGGIGPFWERPKKQLWQEIKDIEQRIGEGLEKPNIKKLARHVFDMLGEYVPLQTIERSYGYWSDVPAIREWADSLFEDGNDPDDQWE